MKKNQRSSTITGEDEQVLALPSTVPEKERCDATGNSTTADDNHQDAISIDQIDFALQPSNQTQEGVEIYVFYVLLTSIKNNNHRFIFLNNIFSELNFFSTTNYHGEDRHSKQKKATCTKISSVLGKYTDILNCSS